MIPAPMILGTADIKSLIILEAGTVIAGISSTPKAATTIGSKTPPKIKALPNFEILISSFPVLSANCSSTFPRATPVNSETILAITQPA